MATQDTSCTIHPYFKVHEGRMEEFQAVCERMVAVTTSEPGCLYYGFSFAGDTAYCREGYIDAGAFLDHMGNVGPLLREALAMADLTRLEVHGPADELDRLREPMASLAPHFFVLKHGFRR